MSVHARETAQMSIVWERGAVCSIVPRQATFGGVCKLRGWA